MLLGIEGVVEIMFTLAASENLHYQVGVMKTTSLCACERGCTCVLNVTHVFASVCQWKKPGQARGGENVRMRYI